MAFPDKAHEQYEFTPQPLFAPEKEREEQRELEPAVAPAPVTERELVEAP